MHYTPQQLLEYWYSPKISSHWFVSTAEIDDDIRNRYEELWVLASEDKFIEWQETANGCLALCIALDQLPLNMFRDDVKAFSTEQKAVAVCKHAISMRFDEQLPSKRLSFLFMPLMHSENMQDQNLSVEMFEKYEMKDNARFAKHHREIVNTYGRFPHRNKILGRDSTPEEIQYLNSDEAFKG